MSQLVKTKNWIPIGKFLEKAGITKRKMYWCLERRQWYNGFVVKKPKGGRSYLLGCYEDFEEWMGE